MLGGFTGAREATEEDQGVLNAVADELRDSHGLNHTNFRAVQVITQVVAGVNYIIKVHCDDSKVVHVKIAKPLPHTGKNPFVMKVDANPDLSLDTPLSAFE